MYSVKGKVIVRGLGVNRGRSSGRVRIVMDAGDISKLKEGDILVTEMTMPEWVPALKKASALVTNLGGATSHAAIVSRELGIPAVVGCDQATRLLEDGQIVTVDGSEGLVCEGAAMSKEK